MTDSTGRPTESLRELTQALASEIWERRDHDCSREQAQEAEGRALTVLVAFDRGEATKADLLCALPDLYLALAHNDTETISVETVRDISRRQNTAWDGAFRARLSGHRDMAAALMSAALHGSGVAKVQVTPASLACRQAFSTESAQRAAGVPVPAATRPTMDHLPFHRPRGTASAKSSTWSVS